MCKTIWPLGRAVMIIQTRHRIPLDYSPGSDVTELPASDIYSRPSCCNASCTATVACYVGDVTFAYTLR